MSYIIPGKTFLVGEYSALVGGSVLGLATGPGFKISYETQAYQPLQDFSLQSPAGQLLQDNSSLFKNLKIQIQDGFVPYGGFGKSTAEYLSVLAQIDPSATAKNFEKIREKYISCSQKSGAEVSGLDLAIQYFGYVTHFDSVSGNYSSNRWAYPNYDFILISTGHKVKTHEHIQKLDKDALLILKPVSEQVIDSYFSHDVREFIIGLNTWSELLEKSGYLSSESKNLKAQLKNNKDILCVKPCGAMGADVLVVICEMEKSDRIQRQISDMSLKVQATSKDLAAGVQLYFENNLSAETQRPYVG